MAKLIPHYDPSEIELAPERVVAEALCSQLPADAVVFHSFPWLRMQRDEVRPDKKDVLREGEADFVVVDPRYGIAVVEVKGGAMRYDPLTQKWDRVGATHPVKNPFQQAANNLRVLEDILKTRSFGNALPLPFGRVRSVVFPNCDYAGTMPPGAERAILFGASDLAVLGSKLEELFQAQPFVPRQRLSPVVLNSITKALTSTFRLIPVLWREIADQERRIVRFTDDQIRLLDYIATRKRAAIEGVAGSGKTMLALAKAKGFADEGQKVLFVCYNAMLAEWLGSQMAREYEDRVTVRHYHGLCAEWCRQAQLTWPQAYGPRFWAEEAPKLLENAIDLRQDDRFDAVVVDEGQDFLVRWWDTIELVNRQPMEGPLYVFYDPAQQLFQQNGQGMPDLGEPFVLPCNCRNTVSITQTCSQIVGKEIRVRPGAAQGPAPTVILANNEDAQRRETARQIRSWMANAGGLGPQQIAVVTRTSVDKSSCRGLSEIADQRVCGSVNEWSRGEGILLVSLRRFKGLEADAVILVDIVPPDGNAGPEGFRSTDYYVACSRAKHRLTILKLRK